MEIASTLVLYATAFAAIVQLGGKGAQRSITHLTLIAGVDQVLPKGVRYVHLLFDAHEIIRAEGAWTESFLPADRSLNGMDGDQRAEIEELFPKMLQRGAVMEAARRGLKSHEARVLLAA